MLMTFYTAPLFSYCPIRFSDIGCFIILSLSIRNNHKVIISPNSIVALLLAFWCIVDSLLLSFYPFFSVLNHYTQFIRFFLSILLYVYSPNLWSVISFNNIVKALRIVLIIHLIIQISYGTIFYSGITEVFNVVSTYEQRTNIISTNYLFSNHFFIVNTSSGCPRFSGLFEEPAWFGWSLNLIIALILQYECKSKTTLLNKRDYILIFLGYALTSSVSAIFSLIVIIVVYYYMVNKKYKLKILFVFSTFICVCTMIVLFMGQSLPNRVAAIIAGNDGSSNFRLIGSWNSLMTLLANNPLRGYGLGDDNKYQYYNMLNSNAFHGITVNGLDILDMHNMLFQIICNLGILGGILFILLLYGLSLRKMPIILVGIILTYFTVNVFNTYFFFTIISIATFYFGKCKQQKTI